MADSKLIQSPTSSKSQDGFKIYTISTDKRDILLLEQHTVVQINGKNVIVTPKNITLIYMHCYTHIILYRHSNGN